ncbi:metal-dependent hydrolase [Halobaculum sp. WSA2]|uniref:Metal-dependent hydrolase n=1 Tax=Halobaculum saliterrae TaxID=2073113 RepID=A0A6B0T2I9_9EURY|nr:metal-dependent hydrolase [Halobaculum saliterrae]MXR40749.1 metal-dependent hydrolase [Halobaculum saliterrae]
MLPLGHLAIAYLWYAGYAAVGTHRLPARAALVPLAIGSQFPDLVDKPLAYLDILISGRSLAHSLFTFAICSIAVWWLARRLRGRWSDGTLPERLRVVTPAAFAVGYLSHLLGDTYRYLLAVDLWGARFLLNPLFPLSTSPGDEIAPWIRLFRIYRDMGTHPSIELIVVAIVVFVGLRVRRYWKRTQVDQV